MGFSNIQELREMAKLPGTRPEMLAADFDGVAEALKGQQSSLIGCYCFRLKNFHTPLFIFKFIYETNSFVHGGMQEVQDNNKR